MELTGRRVRLRPPREDDWPAWAELRAASRDFLTPWEPTWPQDALTRAAFRRRLRQYAEDWRLDAGYSFHILHEGDGRLLGGISLSNVRRGIAQTASLGYWIGAPHARRGYMTEAVMCILDFAFAQLGLRRIEAACLPDNEASQRLLHRTGFQEEGYARKYLRINGEWRDHRLFAVLREDVEAAAGRGGRRLTV